MNYLIKHFFTLLLIIVALISCKKDDDSIPQKQILFSVDLDQLKFNPDNSIVYLAAYTPEGKLLNYGNLSDSSHWNLTAEYSGDKIDILLFSISHVSMLEISHFRNIAVGHLFQDTSRFNPSVNNSTPKIMIKIEDFGNHPLNYTSDRSFEMLPRYFIRGYSYTGEFSWENIENGYTYKYFYFGNELKYQGTEFLIFERSTNKPYVYYMDISADQINEEDTITLNKSDFSPAETKTIQISSTDNDDLKMYLYTYNSVNGRKSLMTSFDQESPTTSAEKSINYVASNILPINNWKFMYFTDKAGSTNYTINSNKAIPSSIAISDLSGCLITKSGESFNIQHSNILPERQLARTIVKFSKGSCGSISYSLYLEKTESVEITSFKPFEMPDVILNIDPEIAATDSLAWKELQYIQIYTNIPGNSAFDYLENSLLKWINNEESNEEYTYEEFRINF